MTQNNMIVGSAIHPKPRGEDRTYPWTGVHTGEKRVVHFMEKNRGVVLHAGTGIFPIGRTGNWLEYEYDTFVGRIEINVEAV